MLDINDYWFTGEHRFPVKGEAFFHDGDGKVWIADKDYDTNAYRILRLKSPAQAVSGPAVHCGEQEIGESIVSPSPDGIPVGDLTRPVLSSDASTECRNVGGGNTNRRHASVVVTGEMSPMTDYHHDDEAGAAFDSPLAWSDIKLAVTCWIIDGRLETPLAPNPFRQLCSKCDTPFYKDEVAIGRYTDRGAYEILHIRCKDIGVPISMEGQGRSASDIERSPVVGVANNFGVGVIMFLLGWTLSALTIAVMNWLSKGGAR